MLLLLFAVSNHLIKCCHKLGKNKFVKTFTFDSEKILDVDFQLYNLVIINNNDNKIVFMHVASLLVMKTV